MWKGCGEMQICSEQEAIFIACEMESAAVQLYQRALHMMLELGRREEPLYSELLFMQNDEEEHLRQFRALYTGLDETLERELALSAVAQGVLFEGGLMGAARQGLLSDVAGMLCYAMQAEKASAQKYREFAELATNEQARTTLLLIAAEEDKHLSELLAQAE